MHSHLLNLRMLPLLKEALGKIDRQAETTPTVQAIRSLLAQRLARVEEQIRTYEQTVIPSI